jgi:hypothetical protein
MFRGRSSCLLEAKHRKSIDNPGEEWLSPWQRGNMRFVGHPETILDSAACSLGNFKAFPANSLIFPVRKEVISAKCRENRGFGYANTHKGI